MADATHKDMFLKVETAKQGAIKGESNDSGHGGEIDILGWSWGMHSKSSMSAGGPSGKATINELHVLKLVDSASTALMSTLRNNEVVKKAVLSVRKAGKGQFEYLKITIENGRVTALDVATDDNESLPRITEKLSFSFHKISVEYTPQGADGQPRGGMLFAAETASTT